MERTTISLVGFDIVATPTNSLFRVKFYPQIDYVESFTFHKTIEATLQIIVNVSRINKNMVYSCHCTHVYNLCYLEQFS